MGGTESESKPLGIMAKKPSVSASAKAGLVLPIAKANAKLRGLLSKKMRVSTGAAVMLSASTEYLLSEVIQAAAKGLKKRKRVTVGDILRGIQCDKELGQMAAGFTVLEGDRVKKVSAAVTLAAAKGDVEQEEDA